MADWAGSVNRIWNGSFHKIGEDLTLPELKNFKAEFFKALAHPLRISILDALRNGEKTVAEISQQFEIEPAYASQQLAVLRNRNIIMARKSGANVYYSVSDPIIFKLLDVAKEIFNNHLVGVRSMLEEIKTEGRRRKP
jgi:DNA-binding transcriptional ArsR family regulator